MSGSDGRGGYSSMVKFIRYKDDSGLDNSIKVNFSTRKMCSQIIVYDYFKVPNHEIKAVLEAIHRDNNYMQLKKYFGYNVSLKNELRKWKAYKVLYKLRIRRKHTKTIRYTNNESTLKQIGYSILSYLCWIFN